MEVFDAAHPNQVHDGQLRVKGVCMFQMFSRLWPATLCRVCNEDKLFIYLGLHCELCKLLPILQGGWTYPANTQPSFSNIETGVPLPLTYQDMNHQSLLSAPGLTPYPCRPSTTITYHLRRWETHTLMNLMLNLSTARMLLLVLGGRRPTKNQRCTRSSDLGANPGTQPDCVQKLDQSFNLPLPRDVEVQMPSASRNKMATSLRATIRVSST